MNNSPIAMDNTRSPLEEALAAIKGDVEHIANGPACRISPLPMVASTPLVQSHSGSERVDAISGRNFLKHCKGALDDIRRRVHHFENVERCPAAYAVTTVIKQCTK